MEINYKQLLDFIKSSGERLKKRTGKIADIGITKTDLTEEDIAIERGFKNIISSFGNDHILYAEEENDVFNQFENVWVVDPISGTQRFIKGEPHYSIVVAHLVKNRAVFAVVYDPSVDEMYTAYNHKGSFLNGIPIKVSQGSKKIILRQSSGWRELEVVRKIESLLGSYHVGKNNYSMAVNYCWVAAGRFDGILSFTKDSFPEFAGGFIVQQAGGEFTNIQGDSNIASHDRVFIGGNSQVYGKLLPLVRGAISQ